MSVIEEISTVGIRNQVTLPKQVREKVKIGEKIAAYIQAVEKREFLVITMDPPSNGVYNRIKISEKGQLVIPKNLRESTGIVEGTNLVFSTHEKGKIRVQKLKEREIKEKTPKRWNFLMDVIDVLNIATNLKDVEIKKGSLIITMKTEQRSNDNLMKELLVRLEGLLDTRLIVEKIDIDKIKMTPLS
ncbi:MAG: AbrB/MazE/SpoVT family DNA-binding domain-containing protein [Candidatus Hodarchaeales archaeon]|jgi:AbrB family looped-hinge helix DNA binding protein